MPRPMMTGYGNDESEMPMGPHTMPDGTMMDNSGEEMMEGAQGAQNDSMGMLGQSQVRTGADVIAACLAQPTLRTGDPKAQVVGTTGKQAEMDYGADTNYGM